MKKRKPPKNISDLRVKGGVWGVIRMYLSAIRLLHKGLGVPRVIFAYLFFLFAIVSLLFTVRVPTSVNFLPATSAAKLQSRVLTFVMMIMNLSVYGMIMNWHRISRGIAAIRVVVIGILLYFDVFILMRILYTLVRESTLF